MITIVQSQYHLIQQYGSMSLFRKRRSGGPAGLLSTKPGPGRQVSGGGAVVCGGAVDCEATSMSWRAQISRSIRELRFVCCDTSQSSQGLRCVSS